MHKQTVQQRRREGVREGGWEKQLLRTALQ